MIRKYLGTICLILLFVAVLSESAMATTTYEIKKNQVNISGQVEANEWVTICVTRQDGKKAYIGQVRSDDSGCFQFIFSLDRGEYSAQISSGEQSTEISSIQIEHDLSVEDSNIPNGSSSEDKISYCYLSVTGDEEKGSILERTEWSWTTGDYSVIDVLKSVLDDAGISYEITYGDTYVKSIDGLAEKKPGYPMSGWLYAVNGVTPNNISAADYTVNNGDNLVWFYNLNWQANYSLPLTDIQQGQPEYTDLSRYNEYLDQGIHLLHEDERMSIEQAVELKNKLDANKVKEIKQVGSDKNQVMDKKEEVCLQIPEDALTEDTRISIEEKTAGEYPGSYAVKLRSSLYEFGPSGTRFTKPVRISIRVAITEDIDVSRLTPAWYNEEVGEWVPLPGVIDLNEGRVVFEIDHFTKFALIEWPTRKHFADITAEFAWAKDVIEILAGQEIIKGTNIGFEPARDISRAEIITLLLRAADIDNNNKKISFTDVKEGDWYYENVCKAVAAGWITGYPDSSFKPNAPISRNELACILARMVGEEKIKPPVSESEFTDIKTIPLWAVNSVKYMKLSGFISGYPDGSYRGDENVNRAEAAMVVYNYLNS